MAAPSSGALGPDATEVSEFTVRLLPIVLGKLSMLNRIFKELGLTGQRGRFNAETVRQGGATK